MQIVRKAIKNPRKGFRYLSNKTLAAFGYYDYTRFIVLSRSRTGSNMLVSFMNSHPNLFAEGEIFSRLNGRKYQIVLAKTFGKQPINVKAKGFKIFYHHPTDDWSCGIWSELVKMRELKVIHLKRRNILRTLVSKKIAKIQKVWLKRSSEVLEKMYDTLNKNFDSKSAKIVTFSAQELKEGITQTIEWEKKGDEMFRNHSLLNLYYEDLASDPQKSFREVTKFLGVCYLEPKTRLRKQNPENLQNLVSNYHELKTQFIGTDLETFFED